MTDTFKTEIDPWADAMRGVRPTVKRPRTIRVLRVTRDKAGRVIKAEVKKEAGR